ncbi:MAG: DUF2523 domain-containing protein [Gammaproteobacteria bacterium]|nr:DUF2523 domain-containing protein [Gammaproteobacteria bacterium]
MGAIIDVLMSFIGGFFIKWGQWLMASIVPTILANLGLGLAYFTGFHAILNYITTDVSNASQSSVFIVDFMALTGVDNVISMLVAALGVRVSMMAVKRVFFTAGGAS